jgi:transcriptional regulator with XRE-family HTH domain
MASVSRATVSRVERGHFGSLSTDTLRRLAAALDVRIDLVPRWRAGDLDRLLNARHSQLHEVVARRFAALPGWTIRPEVSFAIYAERGVVDILAFHLSRNALLVIELKTDIVDLNELVGTVDRKRRLAVGIAREQGVRVDPATRVSCWVIVADGVTNRRRITAHRSMLRAAFPTDGRSMAGWLARPKGAIRALSIWSSAHPGNARTDLAAVRRVRRRSLGPTSVRSRSAA